MTNSSLVYIALALLFFFIKCGGRKEMRQIHREYYSNGQVRLEFEMIGSVKDGFYKSYFPSGQLHNESVFKNDLLNGLSKTYSINNKPVSFLYFINGKKNGECTFFYENGFPLSNGIFRNDLKVGKHLQFFEDDSAKVEYQIEYLIIGGKEYDNGFKKFNRNGEIVESSPLVVCRNTEDGVEIKLLNNVFDKMRVITGDYDRFFDLIDSSSLDTLQSSSLVVEYKPKTDTIRGFVENFKIAKQEGDLVTVISKDIYFEASISGLSQTDRK